MANEFESLLWYHWRNPSRRQHRHILAFARGNPSLTDAVHFPITSSARCSERRVHRKTLVDCRTRDLLECSLPWNSSDEWLDQRRSLHRCRSLSAGSVDRSDRFSMKSAPPLTNYWSSLWCFHYEKDCEQRRYDAIVPELRERGRRRHYSRFPHVNEYYRSTRLRPPEEHHLEGIGMKKQKKDYVSDLFGRKESFAVETNRLEAKYGAKTKWWSLRCVEMFYYPVRCTRGNDCRWTPAENRRHPLGTKRSLAFQLVRDWRESYQRKNIRSTIDLVHKCIRNDRVCRCIPWADSKQNGTFLSRRKRTLGHRLRTRSRIDLPIRSNVFVMNKVVRTSRTILVIFVERHEQQTWLTKTIFFSVLSISKCVCLSFLLLVLRCFRLFS